MPSAADEPSEIVLDPEAIDELGNQRITQALSQTTGALGSFPAIVLSVGIVLIWFVSGPFFGFSDTWQLLINTPTTVITFWMAFIIQSTQNRDGRAIQAKLDELLVAVHGAQDQHLVGLEDKPELEIKATQKRVRKRSAAPSD